MKIVETIHNKYTFLQKLQLAIWLIRTKLIAKDARLIRFPFVLRGGGGNVNLGSGLTTGVGCRIEAFPQGKHDKKTKISFGCNVQINDYVHVSAIEKVEIGDDVLIASHVYISDNSHGCYKGSELDSPPDISPTQRHYITAPVKIGNKVWLGEGAIVMPGVYIGEGCVIGAHSVVTKSIPRYSIAVGNPATVIKCWNSQNRKWERVNQ